MDGAHFRGPSGHGLFTRLPSGLFSPLASPGREWYWKFILDLYDRRFGPDAAGGSAEGILRKYVTQDAENFLLNHLDWMMDGGDATSPVSVRSSQLVDRLIESGWLQIDRRGTKTYVRMHYTVSAFLALMIQFADEGPTVVAGQVQSIHNNLVAVKADPNSQAAAFNAAARDTVKLFGYLNAMTMRVSEVMDKLSKSDHLSLYLRDFFTNYIKTIYIADYGELRTKNHPLRNRRAILDIVGDLADSEASRATLVAWYIKTLSPGDAAEGSRLFDRDVRRFERFSEVDRYLDRLDESITKAISQSVSYIDYRVRNHGRIDRVLKQLMDAAVEIDDPEELKVAFTQGELFGEHMLRDAPEAKPVKVRTLITDEPETARHIAIINLNRLKNLARQIVPARLGAYCMRAVAAGGDSTAMPMNAVSDFTDYMAILTYGIAETAMKAVEAEGVANLDGFDTQEARRKLQGSSIGVALRGYEVEVFENDRLETELMNAPRFVLRRKAEAK